MRSLLSIGGAFAISGAIMSQAYGQASDLRVAISRPAAARAHYSHWKRIAFKEAKDRHVLARAYPFLRGELDGMLSAHGSVEQVGMTPTRVFVADMRSEKKLLLVYVKGSMYCGSHGCNLSVYTNEGRRYKSALTILGFEPFYVSRGTGRVFLVSCSVHGPEKWDMATHAFVSHVTGSDAPACS